MKLGYLFAAPLVFSFCMVTFVRAEEKVEVKAHAEHAKAEFKMKVAKKGDHYVGVHNNHEYILRGDAASRFNSDGEYVVHGDVSTDGVYIETSDFAPAGVTVEVGGNREYRMHVIRSGDHYVGRYNDRDYILRGDSVSHFTVDGDYVIHGEIGADNTYITTTDFQPVPVVVHEREVIIERRQPLIKVGPLEIGR